MELSVNMSTDHASTERAIDGHFGLFRRDWRPFWAYFGGFGGHFGPVLGDSEAINILGPVSGFGGHFGPVLGGGGLEVILDLFGGFGGHFGPV